MMAIKSSLCAARHPAKVQKFVNEQSLPSVRELMKSPNSKLFVTHISDGDGSFVDSRVKTLTGAHFESGGANFLCNETASQRNRRLERTWKLPSGSIVYAQETAAMAQRDWKVIEDYKSVFSLTDSEFAEVVDYIRLWDILRRCCGPQMSSDYRARLLRHKTYKPHRQSGNVAFDACENYDIDAVEKAFIATSLTQRCEALVAVSSGLSWAIPNGQFCKRYIAAAIETRAAFNENPFKLRETGKMGNFDTALK
jgi:hypothetical protein